MTVESSWSATTGFPLPIYWIGASAHPSVGEEWAVVYGLVARVFVSLTIVWVWRGFFAMGASAITVFSSVLSDGESWVAKPGIRPGRRKHIREGALPAIVESLLWGRVALVDDG